MLLRRRLHQVQSAQLVVLPIFVDRLPIVLRQASALQRSVISTYIARIPEPVQPQENSWLIAAGSTDDLTRAIRDALSLPTERLQQYGAAGRERVSQRHSAEIEATRLHRLITGDWPNHCCSASEIAAASTVPERIARAW